MSRFGKKTALGLVIVAAFVTLGAFAFNNHLQARPPEQRAYSSADLQNYLRVGETVLVTIDADWAMNPMDRPFFMSPDASKIIRQRGFVTMTADWTRNSPEVAALVADLNQKEIPALAVYTPRSPDSPVVFNRGHKESDILAALQSVPPR